MAFEIVKTFTIGAPPEAVWKFLTDPERVAKCLPGAAITGKLDEKTWTGTMLVKVGPVQSSYKGKIVFEKLDAQSRTAEIVAIGTDVKGKGGADLRLTSTLAEKGPRQTEVTTVSRVNITGILAQMGRGMIQDVSDQMFKVFSERMKSELESAEGRFESAAAAEAIVPPAGPAVVAPAEALDLGSAGARAVFRRPGFWIAVAVIAIGAWLFLR
jgi:carbon monoxide dehydrogenase subunit G